MLPIFRQVIFVLFLAISPAVFAGVDLVVNVNDIGFDPAVAGSEITYPVRVTNDGDTDATNVSVAISLPANTNFVSATGVGVSCGAPSGGVVTCDFGTLVSDTGSGAGELTTDITIQTTQIGGVTLTVSATSDLADDNTLNDTNQQESTTVNSGADVAVVISGVANVQSGDTYSYALRVTNNGPSDATDQRVIMPIPTGFDVSSVPGDCSIGGGNITCDIPTAITSGNFFDLTPIVGQITAAQSSTVTAIATVDLSPSAPGGAARDPDTGNNTNTFNTTVIAGTDMTIAISRSLSGSQLIGADFNFILDPSYTGDSPNTISVSSTIPSEYTVGAITASQNGWNCGASSQLVTCTRPTGGSAGLNQNLGQIIIPVTVLTAGTNVTTSATISSSAAPSDVDLSNNTADDGGVDLLVPTVDLDIAKSGPSPALVVVGSPFEFSFNVSNSGTAAFVGDLNIQDNLPADLTLNSIATANGWVCLPTTAVGPAVINCTKTAETIAANGSDDGPVINVTATAIGSKVNSATITATLCNLATCNDGDIDTADVTSSTGGASTDISIIKTADIDPVLAGDILTYTLEVINTNSGGGSDITASDVDVDDRLEDLINNSKAATGAGFIDVMFNDNGGTATLDVCNDSASSTNARQLNCTLATLPVCSQGVDCPTFTVRVRPDDPTGTGGNRTNIATAVSQSIADPNTSNNSGSVTTAVSINTDITLAIADTPDAVAAGQNLTYVLTVSNIGPSRADAYTLAQSLPDNVVFVSASPSTGSCTEPAADSIISGGTNHIQCNFGNIGSGSQETLTVVVRPLTGTRGTQLNTTATVATDSNETDNLANTINATTDVQDPELDLQVNISDDIDPLAIGDNTVYSVTTTNNGPSSAEAVVLTVELPDEGYLSYQSIDSGGVTCNSLPSVGDVSGDIFTCDIGYLADNESHTIEIIMLGVAKGVAFNDVSVSSTETLAGFEPNTDNNATDQNTTVRTKVNLELYNKASQDLSGNPISSVNLRENFRYLIQLRNNTGTGLSEADNVIVSDNLPSDMELTGTPTVSVISGTTSLSSCTGVATDGSFSCGLGTVSSGALVDIIAPVQFISVSSGDVTNTATVTTTSLDITANNNSSANTISMGDVIASSIAGTVYRDYDNSGTINGGEIGVPNVTINLTGITFDGAPISLSTTTDSDGNYTFADLPASDGTGYTITEVISDPDLTDGQETAGTEGGSTAVNEQITVVLNDNTTATGYLFAELPIERIGLAKAASGFTDNANGSSDITLTFTVENAGGAPLTNVQINDELSGFGNYTANAVPAPGEYTISAGPSIASSDNSASLTANTNYTGVVGNIELLTAASSSLPNVDDVSTAPGNEASSATVNVTVRFWPIAASTINNEADASATTPTASTVNDDSASGLTPDVNDNDDPSDDTSPTVITIAGQAVDVSKTTGSIAQVSAFRFTVPFTVVVANPSDDFSASFIQASDDLTAVFPTAQSISVGTVVVSSCSGTVLNSATDYNGDAQPNLLLPNQNLLPQESCQLDFTADVVFPSNQPLPGAQTNTASMTSATTNGGAAIASDSDTSSVSFSTFGAIAGRVYRDYAGDGIENGDDIGIPNVAIRLTGNEVDGTAVDLLVNTDSNGDYNFDNLSASNASGYTITETLVDPDLTDGQETLGTAGGTITSNDVMTVVLNDGVVTTDYLFAETAIARIGLAKSAGAITSNNDGTHDVSFTFNIENAGGTALSDVQIVDDLSAFGTYTVNAIPNPGQYTVITAPSVATVDNGASLVANAAFTGVGVETRLLDSTSSVLPTFDTLSTAAVNESSSATVTFTLRFFPTTSTIFENTAIASGVTPAAITVSDNSVDGVIPDADLDNDPGTDAGPTPVVISGQEISVSKSTLGVIQVPGQRYDIPFRLIVSNPGSQFTASFVQVNDNLRNVFVDAESIVISSPVVVSSCTGTVLTAVADYDGELQTNLLTGNQNLQPGEQCQIDFSATIDFGSNALPNIATNIASVTTATQAGGVPVISENDFSDIEFAGLASVSGRVWRDINHNRIDDGEQGIANYTVELLNTRGEVIASAETDGDGNYVIGDVYPSTPGEPSTEYRVQFREPSNNALFGAPITNDPVNSNGNIENGVINSLALARGVTTINQSLPLDPSGVVYDSITREPIDGAQVILTGPPGFDADLHLVGGAGNVTQLTGNDGFYQYLFLNAAPDGIYSLTVIEPAGYLPGGSQIIPVCDNVLQVGATPAPLLIHNNSNAPASNVVTHDASNCATNSMDAAANNATTQYYLQFDLNTAGSADVLNNHIPLDLITDGALTVTKTTPKVNVKRGELIPYTIRATNNFSSNLPSTDIVDQLPAGFKYKKNSAQVNGVDNEPVVDGRVLRWSSLTFTPNETREFSLLLIPGAGVSEGEYVNQAWAENNIIGQRISNIGKATVRIIPDPLFDCTDLIGKVFDDKNLSGYQDQGEPPLPRVRLATARGLVVTTDEYGRFHIACAAIPNQDRGSNFIIKLDERSLPSGYRLTTENPRVVRLTRGKLEEADFGAAIHRVVRLDITDAVFVDSQVSLVEGYEQHFDQLLEVLKQAPSVVRIAYISDEPDSKLLKQRLRNMKKVFRRYWKEHGCCHQIVIETEAHQNNQSARQQENES